MWNCRPSAHVLVSVLAIATITVGGCAQILGFDDVQPAAGQDGSTARFDASALPPDANVVPHFACTSQQFIPEVGTALLNTEIESDDETLSCGTASATEALFSWRAPATDYYVFDTIGSEFDTVIALKNECDGAELACNNNLSTDATASELVQKIMLGRNLIVAVEGFAGDQGSGQLNIARVACPDSDLEDQVFPVTLSTSGAGDDNSTSCGGAGQSDRAFHWVVPSDGLYAFKVVAAGYRAVISVLDGPRCKDTELGCSKSSLLGARAEVVRRLVAGQQVSLYVDGVDGAGAFEIDVSERVATCPEDSIDTSMLFVQGGSIGPLSGTYSARTLAPSCGFPEISDGIAAIQELRDMTYQLDIPGPGAGCSADCTVTVSSPGTITAYLLDENDCSGREIDCKNSSFGGDVTLNVSSANNDAGTYTLVVSEAALDSPDYSIQIDCMQICS